jgi:hypothetical protein
MTPKLGRFRPIEPGYGPDNLPYEQALEREWAKQPKVPAATEGTHKNIPARRVAPVRQRRYDRRLTNDSTTKEGAMPPRKAAVAEPEEAEGTETDLTVYAEKQVTPVAQALTEWLIDETGYEVDERSVYLTMALRRRSRLDPGIQDRVEEIREERKAAAEAAKPPKPVKAAAEESEEAPAAKPRRARATATTSTSSTAKPAGRTRAAAGATPKPAGRTRAKAGATSGTAPF